MIKPAPRGKDAYEFKPSEEVNNYIITERGTDKIGVLFAGNKAVRLFKSVKDGLLQGTVLIGKISEIQTNINAAFVLTDGRTKCFLPLNFYRKEANLTACREPKCGDNILIEIVRCASKGKLAGARCTVESIDKFRDVAMHRTEYSVLKNGEDCVNDFLYSEDEIRPDRVLTDIPEAYDELISHFGEAANAPEIHLYRDDLVSLSVLYSLEKVIADALNRKVWLKSGGYICIEPTEALTVIDVNSGKYDKKTADDDTYFNLNIESFDEILRQMSLRNLSGIIIIDFIKLKNKEKQQKLLDYMRTSADKYDSTVKIVDLTKLGLAELTRLKKGRTIYEQFLV